MSEAVSLVAPRPILERYEATMVLSGVGDAMGYHAGGWEFVRVRCEAL